MRPLPLFTLLLFFSTTSIAQTQLGANLNGSSGEEFGWPVALSGDGETLAVGAYDDNAQGSVYIYGLDNNTWAQIGSSIVGVDPGENSGKSIALSNDGTTVAIGSNFPDTDSTGLVRVFKLESGDWVQVGANIEGEGSGDLFGTALDLSEDGNIIAIGANENDGNGQNSGHVRVFQFNSGKWEQIGNDIDGENLGDQSGNSVSLSSDGSIVAIGADFSQDNGSESGHVRVFEYNSGSWSQIGMDIIGQAPVDHFGASVSLSADGKTLAVGAPGHDIAFADNAGNVRVFEYKSGDWLPIGSPILGEASQDNFGMAISLSADGSILACGAWFSDSDGPDAGRVKIYRKNLGVWLQLGKTLDGSSSYNYFGSALSLSADGNKLAIGAFGNDDGGAEAGQVKVFSLDEALSTNPVSPQNELSLYPIPAKDVLSVLGIDENISYSMLNYLGQVIISGSLNGTSNSINVRELSPGTYFLKLGDAKLSYLKVVVE